ncbi:hypothetical protein KCU67_g92, partial [Aureobasidium melanogenum]
LLYRIHWDSFNWPFTETGSTDLTVSALLAHEIRALVACYSISRVSCAWASMSVTVFPPCSNVIAATKSLVELLRTGGVMKTILDSGRLSFAEKAQATRAHMARCASRLRSLDSEPSGEVCRQQLLYQPEVAKTCGRASGCVPA